MPSTTQRQGDVEWLKAPNEMADLWQHAAMSPVERMVRRHSSLKNTGAWGFTLLVVTRRVA